MYFGQSKRTEFVDLLRTRATSQEPKTAGAEYCSERKMQLRFEVYVQQKLNM